MAWYIFHFCNDIEKPLFHHLLTLLLFIKLIRRVLPPNTVENVLTGRLNHKRL